VTFELTVPTTATEAALADPAAVIGCIPGVERCEPGADGYDLTAVVAVGPVRLRLTGRATLTPADGGLTAAVSLHDALAGSIYGTFAVALGEGAVTVRADVVVGGRLGEFAAPILRRKAEESVRAFAANLGRLAAGA
jgi:carbon monoxide dehydrogenase subunit G